MHTTAEQRLVGKTIALLISKSVRKNKHELTKFRLYDSGKDNKNYKYRSLSMNSYY